MPGLHIRLLGDFQIVYGGAPLASITSARLQSLFAYLLIHRGIPQSRAHVAFQFWPDSSEAQAQANLRYFLHQLRRALPDAAQYLQADKTILQWRAEAPYSLDVADFERAVAGAEKVTSARGLEEAVAYYTGDLLPSCYDDWIVPERERLRELFVKTLDRLSASYEQRSDYASAINSLQRLLRHDPLREATYRHLMRLYALNGDPVDISRTYQTCVAVLERELSVEPSATTREEYERLVRETAHAAPPASADVQAPDGALASLPTPLTSFVGREREAGELEARLQTTRLLTLTGPGGSGKTRLALAVAARLAAAQAFADGVSWVELAALTDGALVPRAVASALGISEQADRNLSDSLCDALRLQHRLLVLDNCEHLVEACAQLVRQLLDAAPRLHIVVTSREALNLAGETTWLVPSLGLPPLPGPEPGGLPPFAPVADDSEQRTIARAEAVQLFTERAGSALPSFRLTERNARAVAHICLRLDGIPLAIELAAARAKVLSVQQIALRLDDRFALLTSGHRDALPRHQSLRATIDWSYELLNPHERTLLQRLSVFAGGCTLEAAEAVCAFDGQLDVLNGLALLVDKSLLEQTFVDGEPRFRMLETIRAYARERLAQSGESQSLARAHAQYYRHLVQTAEPHFFGAELGIWLNRLDHERDNIRAALEWSKSDDTIEAVEIGLHLAALLWRFWRMRGYVTEGRQWLDALLARSGALHTQAKALALQTAGNLSYDQGDLERAKQLYQACLSLAQELGNRHYVGHMHNNLGNIAIAEGEYDQAAALYSQALAYYRERNWAWGVSVALENLGSIAHAQGRYDSAQALYEESLALCRQSEDKERIAMLVNALGRLAEDLAHYDEATNLFQEALTLREQIGDQSGIPNDQHQLGKIAHRQGDSARAIALFEQSLTQFQKLGDKRGIALALSGLGDVARTQGQYARALELYTEGLALFRSVGDKRDILDGLEGLAQINAAQGAYERAARLWGAAEALRHAIHSPTPPSKQESHAQTVHAIRGALGDDVFARASAEGQAMTPDQAVSYALETQTAVNAEAHGL